MKKIALLFGNNDYETLNSQLDCAVNDAQLLSTKLEELGFSCNCHINLNRNEMGIKLAEFEKKLDSYDVGLFYFAGHGFEIDSTNYLASVDTGMQDPATIKHTSLNLNEILTLFGNSKLRVKIIILDACRSNLPQGIRGVISNSFAPIAAPVGTIIAFSTSPGQVAREMPDKTNGYYTKSLVEHIGKAGIPIEDMFKHVRETLSAYTKKQQVSWEHTSLLGNFYFNPTLLDNQYSTLYSQESLEDELFIISMETELGILISTLKSYDFYKQSDAINKIHKLDLSQSNREELFVLGRNIYQSAVGGCYRAEGFIERFEFEVSRFNPEVTFHILNGIVYEIYFNKKGRLRQHIKSKHYNKVLSLIEKNNSFKNTLVFIQNSLVQYTDQVLYIPGTFVPIELIISIETNDIEDGEDTNRYYIKQIYSHGQPILYDESGQNLFTSRFHYTIFKNADFFETHIRRTVGAPFGMVRFKYDKEINRNQQIELTDLYTLRYSPID